jgi:hypothetical protein
MAKIDLGIWNYPVAAGLGTTLGIFGAQVLRGVVKMMHSDTITKNEQLFTVLGFLFKFPLIIGGLYLCMCINKAAVGVFTCAIIVVYSVLVWRAHTSRHF